MAAKGGAVAAAISRQQQQQLLLLQQQSTRWQSSSRKFRVIQQGEGSGSRTISGFSSSPMLRLPLNSVAASSNRLAAAAASPTVSIFARAASSTSSAGSSSKVKKAQPLVPPKSFDCDLVGPPDKISNLRPVLIHIPESESDLRKKLRILREETHEWSQDFWRKHNSEFKEKKDIYVQKVLKSRSDKDKETSTTLTSDEMSAFYRDFLNEQRRAHLQYNLEWQKRNAKIVWLSFKVALEDIFTEKKK